MIIFKQSVTLGKHIEKLKASGKSIGFVPTMGALHNGHVSLIKASGNTCDVTVSSIFVNPTQFNDPKDFEKYPVTLTDDILLLERTACDILFLPSVEEMYPGGVKSSMHYDLGSIENVLEGKYRPGHFQGVSRIVHKLLNVASPDFLFMGQKDYQQLLVIKRLIELYDIKVKVIAGDTFRETTGLAMSSRNLRLSDSQKQKATGIYTMLNYIKTTDTSASPRELEKYVVEYLLNNGFEKVDYVSITDTATLHPIDRFTEDVKSVALIAAYIGGVRLIDNMMLAD